MKIGSIERLCTRAQHRNPWFIGIVPEERRIGLICYEQKMERRHFKRHDARIAITVWARDGKMAAEMDNLSVTGCRIECRQRWLERGDFVRLLLPGDLEVKGRIAWILRNRFGVEFAENLQPSVVRKLGFR